VFEELKELVRVFTGKPDFEFEPHFTPSYRPWQQRLAFCPEGDVFRAAVAGKLTVMTDTIDRFTEKGLLTASGEEIEADLIVAATGFQLSVMGDIPFAVDGEPVDWHDTVTYRGMMFTGVPNMAWVMGYFRASWTLRVDMMGDFVCGLLGKAREKRANRVEVQLRPEDEGMELSPWIETDNFNPGYLMRGLDKMPRRGDKHEWRHNQDYWAERTEIPAIDFGSSEFVYDGVRSSDQPEPQLQEA
jgi:cation diffusion facilitator CzcD-associated flavoprotein CzcO